MRVANAAASLVAAPLVAALLVACGSSPSTSPDGGGGGDDAGGEIDADPNVRGTVTVRIVDKNDAPLPDFYVVFVDRDGTVTETTTDAAGMAQADVYPSATVTAIRTRGMSYALATVQGLVPGDDIQLVSAASTVSSSEDPFSSRLVPPPGANIAASPDGARKNGPTATFTTIEPHGLSAGDRVIVAKVSSAGYNGAWTVASVPSPTTFTANLGNGNLPPSGSGAAGATATKAIAFTISYPAYSGANHYEVHTRCGTLDVGLATAPELVLPVTCTLDATDIEVLAKTSAGALLAWTVRPDVTINAGGSATITDTWHAPAPLTATYTNPTALVTDIAVARFSPEARGLPVAETTGTASATTTLNLDVSLPPRAVIGTQLTCPLDASSACLSNNQGAPRQQITEHVDGTQGSYALDIGASLLPWLQATYVPQTTTLEVTVTASAPIDLFEANLRYTRGQTIYTWRVFGPAAGSVAFPTLPATAPGDPTIRPSDVMSGYQVFACESDAFDGYRDAVANPFVALGTCEASASTGVRAYGGTKNRISQWN